MKRLILILGLLANVIAGLILQPLFAPFIEQHDLFGSGFEMKKGSKLRTYLDLDREPDVTIVLMLRFNSGEEDGFVKERARLQLNRLSFDRPVKREEYDLGAITNLNLRARVINYVHIRLTNEQEVYKEVQNAEQTTIIGAGVIEFFGAGVYQAPGPRVAKPIHVEMSTLSRVRLYGFEKGGLHLLDDQDYPSSF